MRQFAITKSVDQLKLRGHLKGSLPYLGLQNNSCQVRNICHEDRCAVDTQLSPVFPRLLPCTESIPVLLPTTKEYKASKPEKLLFFPEADYTLTFSETEL